jgi:eukaryotic-like serine/threonine-protein kinase
MAAAESDSSLLFGILALQNGLIEPPDLIAAFQCWFKERSRPMAQLLIERGALTENDRTMLDGLIRRHDETQGNGLDDDSGTEAAPGSLIAGSFSAPRPDCHRADPLPGLSSFVDGDLPQIGDLTVGLGTALGHKDAVDSRGALGQMTTEGGRFQVLRQHARGGIGVVYVARDSELNREVALKQIQLKHADDPASRARFLVEAEVTGRLEHPGIVPVYGLGTSDQGRPFYAMRFVRGQSLKEAIDDYHGADSHDRREPAGGTMALRQLLARYIDVCHAVAYSHSRGVLHRDLKPANILLGPYGETLVVDWGLAKVIGRDEPTPQPAAAEVTLRPSSQTEASETKVGAAIGTPSFMSPEQSEGRGTEIGPASDVYSLGATLYYLVTGKPALSDTSLENLLVRLRRGAIDPPRQVSPRVPPALEAIVMKAMALRPADRYPTAQALGQDVERWLADEPVLARREPWSERARRWMRRRRTGVAAVAAALVAATAGLAAVLVVQTEANRKLKSANLDLALAIRNTQGANRALQGANDRERTRFDLALEAIKTFHSQVSEDLLLKEKQFDGMRTTMLKSATDFYERLEDLLKEQSDHRSRAALGQAYHDIGELTARIGSQPEALAALKRSLELRVTLANERRSDQLAIRNVGASLIAIGNVLDETGDLTGALASYWQALELLHPLVQANPDNAADSAAVANCLHGIASGQYHSGYAAEALATHEQALALRRKLADANPGITQFQGDLAQSYHDIGEIHRASGRAVAALAAYEKGRAISQELTETDASATQFQSDLAQSYIDVGRMNEEMDDFAAALTAFERAQSIAQRLAEANPAVSRFEGVLAQSYQGIGSVQDHMGLRDLAFASFDRARMILQKLADANPTLTIFQNRLAMCHSYVGAARQRAGRPADAAAEFQKAVAIMERLSNLQPNAYDLYNLACFQSLLSGIAAETGSGLTAADVERLGEQAMATLRRAVAAGLQDIEHMRKDLDLEPLRSRGDFQLLLMDLAFPTEPYAR